MKQKDLRFTTEITTPQSCWHEFFTEENGFTE